MSQSPPVQDGRTAEQVLAELEADRPGYLPGWQPQPRGAGHATLAVLSRFAELVIQGLDEAPAKAFLTFLQTLGLHLLPPRPSRAPVVFTLAPRSPVDSPAPRDSEVAAAAAPVLPKKLDPQAVALPAPPAPIFQTDQSISLARASLTALYSIDPLNDSYADHTADITSGFTIFLQPMDQVPHQIYLGHDSLFALADQADVVLEVTLPSVAAPGSTPRRAVSMNWEYLSSQGWVVFPLVDDTTQAFTQDGQVRMHKLGGAAPKQGTVNGITSYWIRGRLIRPLSQPGSTGAASSLPLIATLRAMVSFAHAGLPVQAAFGDGLRLDTTKDFYPLGRQPEVSSSFTFACDDALQRKEAKIGLSFQLSRGVVPVPSGDLQLVWEYSTGPGAWQQLGGSGTQLDDQTINLTSTLADPAVTFIRPNDWEKVPFNGETHYWIRLRIARGNYGGPPTYTIDNTTHQLVVSNQPQPPILTHLTVSYGYVTPNTLLDHCLVRNMFDFADETLSCQWGSTPFSPFRPVDDRLPAVYLGFDQPLPEGLVSLFVDLGDPALAGLFAQSSTFTWEYRSGEGWSELSVLDDTAGFRVSGMVQFVAPSDSAVAPGPTIPLYWVRARYKVAAAVEAITVQAVYLNAVQVTQRTTVRGEVLGRSDGSPRLTLPLQHPRILEGQVVQVQEWRGDGREWQSLFRDVPDPDLHPEHDALGNVTAVWITWHERAHLYSSRRYDRHYMIERTRGLVSFGDGSAGMIPQPGSAISCSYSWGGSLAGNVPVGAINQIHSVLPYVQGASNPVAAAGGSASETIEGVARRGPKRLKSGGRAVTEEDYEWLAKEVSSEVALAHCLPLYGPDGVAEPGWVTLVIVPSSEDPRPEPTSGLLHAVRTSLATVAPAAIGPQIRVVGPSYTPISVRAELVAGTGDAGGTVEDTVRQQINAFLHPITGGSEGSGWRFGDTVHVSLIARLLRLQAAVDEVRYIDLTADGFDAGESVVLEPGRLPCAGRHVLKIDLVAV